MKHSLSWFKERIGKKIYRDDTSCDCKTCTDITHNGLIIRDRFHAEYLDMIQYELEIDYRDTK